jgi:hypothetical protein
MNDPIVDEVRRVRDEYAARFNYDLDEIFNLLSAHLVSKFGELHGANKSTFVNRGRDAEEAQELALQG